MTKPFTRITQSSLFAASICLAGWISLASAKDESSVVIQTQAEPAAGELSLIPPANDAAGQPLPPRSNPHLVSEAEPKQSSAAPKQPFLRAVESRRRVPATAALDVTEEPMPAPEPGVIIETPEFEVRPAPPIKYDTDGDARRMYRKSGEVQVVMVAQNPADGCHYEIPMCIPGCCVGEPKVSGGRGLLGRGVVEFCWECGFRAQVKFRQFLGDVKVEYEGD